MKVTSPEAYKLLHQGTLALSQIEHNGIRIDTEYLENTVKESKLKIREIETTLRKDPIYASWRKRYQDKTNLDSTEQLGDMIFNVLKYPCVEHTGTGKPKTDEANLQRVDNPFVKDYLFMKKLKKMTGTFLKGIQDELADGFIHPSFDLHTTITMRSSSRNPNFQNFPARNKFLASTIRKCFIPRKGRRLVEIDFSGVEVKIAYCHHKDPQMGIYLRDPKSDMHRDTASDLFYLSRDYLVEHKDWAKKTVRDWAKNRFVFPEFYGDVYFQRAPHIWEECIKDEHKLPGMNITIRQYLASKGINKLGACDPQQSPIKGTFEYHVKEVEDLFWNERFPVYTQWKRSWYESYLNSGGFTTYTGFRINGFYKKNQVLNLAIQGEAFFCLLTSLIDIQKWLSKYRMKTLIVGQIHDSMLLDMEVSELQDVISKCHEVMTVDLLEKWKWIITPMDVEVEASEIDGNWWEKSLWVRDKESLWQKKVA